QETEPNDTLPQAQPLAWSPAGRIEVVGQLGEAGDAADVDWYLIHLDAPAQVTLDTVAPAAGHAATAVLSLYNTTDPYDVFDQTRDYYETLGHRLLAQADGADDGGPSHLERNLMGPGDYYVAVSGSGNRFFHPLIADTGYPGSTGHYAL